jgi:hypothetical protein
MHDEKGSLSLGGRQLEAAASMRARTMQEYNQKDQLDRRPALASVRLIFARGVSYPPQAEPAMPVRDILVKSNVTATTCTNA